jgi:hypothetical protein
MELVCYNRCELDIGINLVVATHVQVPKSEAGEWSHDVSDSTPTPPPLSFVHKFNESCATTTNMVSSETIVSLPLPRDQEKGGRTSSGVRPRYHTLEVR